MFTRSLAILRLRKGQALLEAALLTPLLLLLLLGIYEFSRSIQAENIVTNMSREAANLSARTGNSDTDIMNAVISSATPLDMQNKGMMYITTIQGVAGGGAKIMSQTAWTHSGSYNPASRIGTPTVSTPNPAVRVRHMAPSEFGAMRALSMAAFGDDVLIRRG